MNKPDRSSSTRKVEGVDPPLQRQGNGWVSRRYLVSMRRFLDDEGELQASVRTPRLAQAEQERIINVGVGGVMPSGRH